MNETTRAPGRFAKPDFLMVGAESPALDWLRRGLDAQPRLWTPPVVDLGFFDNLPNVPEPDEVATESKRAVKNRERGLARAAKRNDTAAAAFIERYPTGSRTVADHVATMPSDLVVGESSPGSQLMRRPRIAWLSETFPSLKILVVLTDPIDRDWAHAVRRLGRDRDLAEVPEDEMHEFLGGRRVTKVSDYASTIRRWETTFRAERLGVFFTDDFLADPEGSLRAATEFVSGSAELAPKARRVLARNPLDVAQPPIPPAIEKMLGARRIPMLELLADRFSHLSVNHPAAWLERARRVA